MRHDLTHLTCNFAAVNIKQEDYGTDYNQYPDFGLDNGGDRRLALDVEERLAQWKFSGDKHKSLQVDTERTFHQQYPLVML